MRTSSPAARPCSPARLGLAVALTALVAGCSVIDPSATTPAEPTAPVTTASPPALSGQQLTRILLPASSMPKGYRTGSATRNTGSELPSDSPQPVPANQVCVAFTQTSYIRAGGITANDWAAGEYISPDQSQEVFEEINVFTGTDAQKAMATLWQEFGKCSSFSYKANGTTAASRLTRSRLPGVGDDAIEAVIVSPLFQGGETIVAIRVGSQVITTLDSASTRDLGSPAVGYAEKIAQRLRAAE